MFKQLRDEFIVKMRQRLDKGKVTYGNDDYLKKDNLKEIEDELLDVANYALLQYIKIKQLGENEKR